MIQERIGSRMVRQLFLKKKSSLQVGVAILIALLTFIVPTMSASAQTVAVKQTAEIAPQCEIFQQEVTATENEIAILTTELNGADFSERSFIAREIRQQTTLENQELAKLNACVTANPGLPPLNATLTGTITFIISADGLQEHTAPLSMGITFSPFRDQVNFSLPSVDVPGLPVSATESTVSAGTGTFNKTSGAITEATELLFTIHNPLAQNSTGAFTFTTGNSVSPDGQVIVDGSPLNSSGGIELVAATHFTNGSLSGMDGAIFLIGKITPLP